MNFLFQTQRKFVAETTFHTNHLVTTPSQVLWPASGSDCKRPEAGRDFGEVRVVTTTVSEQIMEHGIEFFVDHFTHPIFGV